MPPTNILYISKTGNQPPPTGVTNDNNLTPKAVTELTQSIMSKPINTKIDSIMVVARLNAILTNEPAFLEFLPSQTDEFCMIAVKMNGLILKYVKNQTPEISFAAVQQNGYALQFVKNQTLEICVAAVQQNGFALKYSNYQTLEICLAAVQEIGYALKYVKYQTPEICQAALLNEPMSFEFVESKTYDICKFAYGLNIETARFMPDTNSTPVIDVNMQYCGYSSSSRNSSSGGSSVGSSGLSCGYSHSTSENYSRKHGSLNLTSRSLFSI